MLVDFAHFYSSCSEDAHVLLNLLNELGKRNKLQGLPTIILLFRNEFNKFNNTREWMLDSICHSHMKLKILQTLVLGMQNSRFCHYMQCCYDCHFITLPNVIHWWFIDFNQK